ncbi:hypothetical protein CK203_114084 [Vitis vinifera]|uniref:Reverse transcriptase zinc-binding domain-containing protein n=1 Tax=Vitis vinifera TaxID=29760 RepID=A0A438C8C0_VITVI|nr:hypothetical protein CK203_114084 [Vitis vinifera]
MSRRFVVKGKSLWKQVIVEKFREEVCEWCSIGMRKDLRQGMASNKKTLGRLTLKLNQFYANSNDVWVANSWKELGSIKKWFKRRLASWKGQYFSKGFKLALRKSTLSFSQPLCAFFFDNIITFNKLEKLHRGFLLGVEIWKDVPLS